MNRVINDDCFNVFSTLEDNSIDAIITDPPYGVLKGHKIETNVDIPRLASECFRVLKPDSPMVFFGLMPKSLNWLNVFMEKFTFRSELFWCKRRAAGFLNKVPRIHESIYLLSKGSLKYNKIKGKYEDVKKPMYLDGLLTEEAYQMEGKNKIKLGVTRNEKHFSKQEQYHRERNKEGIYRKTEYVKFQSVWSFAAHNVTSFGQDETNIKHPTVKPLLLMDRLIELTTF